MKKAHIWVRDEVYMTISGLEPSDVQFFWNKYGIPVDGYFFMPAYKLGRWDGKIRFFDKTGKVFMRFLGEIVPFLEKWGYDIELHDERLPLPLVQGRLHENWFEGKSQVPIVVRPYQVEAVNAALDAGSGVILAATGSGKTIMCAALVDVMGQNNLRSLIIVPSGDLVEQTSNTLKLCSVDHGVYSGAKKDLEHQHVVATWQSLQNKPEILETFQTVVVDECFAGDQLVLSENGPVRIDQIQVGDRVVSQKNDVLVLNTVDRVFARPSTKQMLELHFDNGAVIKVTENHNFFTTAGKVQAKDLTEEHEIFECGNYRDAMSIAKTNGILSLANQNLRVLRIHSTPDSGQKIISVLLNNGRTLNGSEYKQMRRRLNTRLISHFDSLYSTNVKEAESTLQQVKSEQCSLAGKRAKGKKRTTSKEVWNKGVKTGQVPWNKGKDKTTDNRLMAISEARLGALNPQYGKPISKEHSLKLSTSIRKAIASGKFTPNIHNSRTLNRKSSYDGKTFRSSWEALFWSCNQHLIFESSKHRKTLSDGSVFIPDFVDVQAEIVYEVKPKCKFLGSKSERGLKEFSLSGWTTVVITEDILKVLYKLCDRSKFDADTLRRLDNSFKKYADN